MVYCRWALLFVLPSLMGVSFFPASARSEEGKQWGSIKGQIVWSAANLPPARNINVPPDHKDKPQCLANGAIPDEEWVVNPKNKGIRWVFVWVAGDKADSVIPIHPELAQIKQDKVVLDQPCCQFTPHAVGMREGQTLIAKNSAPVAHNVHWTGHPLHNPGGNVIVPSQQSHEISDLKGDKFPVSVRCDIHGWMNAWVRVFKHPYFAVTDENGSFEIKKLPAGDFRLYIWHETGWRGGSKGRTGEPITIKGGEATELGQLKMEPPPA